MSRTRFLKQQAERLRAALERTKAQESRLAAQAEHEAKDNPNAPGNANLAAWQGLVEQRIQDAMSRGMFDNLEGTGKPLNLWDDAFVPEDMRMGFRLLRSTGLAPLWVELNKEIYDDIRRMHYVRVIAQGRWHRISVREREQLRDDHARRVREINDKILRYNLMAPSSQVHLGLLLPNEETRAFEAAIAHPSRP